jgi:hypothetical protein
MTTITKRFGIGLVSIIALTLAACGGSGSGDSGTGVDNPATPAPPSTEPPPPSSNVGYLNLSVSDSPIKDATKVCVRFDGVELKHADSEDKETIDFEQPVVVNLLAHQGANSAPIVTGAEVPAGVYEWIRLKVAAQRDLSGGANDSDPTSELCDDATENSYLVRESGGVYNLFVPSGSQRGLQLIKEIIIPVNRTGNYTAEWDLGKSFNGPPGQMPDVMMKPVVKLVANNEVGTLVGGVADELIAWEACDAEFSPSVYVFDDGVVPNPFDDPFAADDAVATGLVSQQMQGDGSMPWRYEIGFLLVGNYEVAYTCNGSLFAPLAGKPAEILLEEVTTVDFLAEDAPGMLVGQVDSVFFDPAAPESGFCDAQYTPTVFVFDEGVEPNFVDTPVATGEVAMDLTTEQYGYSIPLMAANYNAAFTCTGTDFIPAAGKPAEILPGTDTMVDFLASDAPPPVGSLSGTVATELVGAASCDAAFADAVHVFAEGVTPNTTDLPVATGAVTMDMTTGANVYLIENLLADTYVAAFTCNGTSYVPVAGKEAVITIGEDTSLEFVAADAPST